MQNAGNDKSEYTGEIWTDPLTNEPYFQLAGNINRWVTSDGERQRIAFPSGASEFRNKDGTRHRLAGPAVYNRDGTEEWWINGVRVDFDELAGIDFPADFE